MAITPIAPSRLSTARETIIYFSLASNVTMGTGSDLKTLFGTATDVSAAAKNVTVSPPETAWELQSFLGTASSFQNQMLDEKPVGLASFSATLILDEDEILEGFLDTTATSPTGYSRYQIGNNTSPEIAILVSISDGSDYVNIAFDDARITKWGDVRISGPDGHWEQDIAATCLCSDFFWEYTD